MKKVIKKFFASIRQKLFEARMQREIYFRIFPHINQEADHGYSFASLSELSESGSEDYLTTESTLRMIERAARKMPKAEGDALRHIACRDMNERMWRYLKFAAKRIQPATCDPREIATRAPA